MLPSRADPDTSFAVRLAPTAAIKKLVQKVGSPLFLTSANKSDQPPCDSIAEVLQTFPDLDGVLEGDVTFGQASTIIRCEGGSIQMLRSGPISLAELQSSISGSDPK